jgi:lipoprotein NlpD
MHWSDEPSPRPHHARESARSVRESTDSERTYTVKAGDTLYSIARKHGVDYHDLAKWNGIGSDYRLEIGQVLKLDAAKSATPKRRAKAPVEVAHEDVTVAPREAPEPAAAAMERYYQWQWPLRGEIAKTYSPEGGSKGLDIAGDLGQTVIAAAPGRVVYSGSGLKGYGELVIIKHDETYLSAYGYNRKRLVNEGDLVTAGQAIAEVGLGPEQKPLLHFEIREHGKPIDPLPLLPKQQK